MFRFIRKAWNATYLADRAILIAIARCCGL